VRIERRTPGSARGIRKPQRKPLVSVGCPLSYIIGAKLRCPLLAKFKWPPEA